MQILFLLLVGLLKRFQGQTSWQVSQPNIQLSNFPFISPGISISFQFNGEIRNTFTSINYFIGKYGIGRAGINTFGTGAAIIFCKRIIIFQFQVSDQCGNEIKRTTLFVDQVSIFTNPSQAASLCPGSFKNRCAINKSTSMYFSDVSLILSINSFSFSLITS